MNFLGSADFLTGATQTSTCEIQREKLYEVVLQDIEPFLKGPADAKAPKLQHIPSPYRAKFAPGTLP